MPITRRRRASVAALLSPLLIVLLAGCIAPPGGSRGADGAKGLKKISVGVPTIMGPNNSPIAVAQGLGYFADEGLDVEFVTTGGSAESVQSTLTGQIDIGSSTSEPIYQLAERGKSGEELVMVYNYLRAPTGSIAVRADSPIRDLGDFAGATIGADSLGSGNVLLAEGILQLGGVDADAVDFVATGTGAPALQALRSGKVDALSLWDTEYAAMEKSGMKLRFFSHDKIDPLFSTTFFVTPDFLKNESKTVASFGRAMAKATVFASENPAAALQVMYSEYPETRVAGKSLEDQLDTDLTAFRARLERLTAGDPAANSSWGRYPDGAVQAWLDFALTAGIVKKKLDPTPLYANDLVPEYNAFDAPSVLKEAQTWKP
ncbi:ABC transporter substrate-binding protein [Micromonospora sp. B11E3]|uniref:ABC transporter substrate-binding protein n=1 Tax=Micromonospora sp. B11E3 TaxID=3153562 RepID=UPI00325F0216